MLWKKRKLFDQKLVVDIQCKIVQVIYVRKKRIRTTNFLDAIKQNENLSRFEVQNMNKSEKNSNQSEVENVQTEVRYEEANGLSIDLSEINEEERRQVKKLIKNKEKVFAKKDLPLTKALSIEHDSDTGDALPISSRKYRATHKERPIIQELIQDMLKKINKPSRSPWSSSIV